MGSGTARVVDGTHPLVDSAGRWRCGAAAASSWASTRGARTRRGGATSRAGSRARWRTGRAARPRRWGPRRRRARPGGRALLAALCAPHRHAGPSCTAASRLPSHTPQPRAARHLTAPTLPPAPRMPLPGFPRLARSRRAAPPEAGCREALRVAHARGGVYHVARVGGAARRARHRGAALAAARAAAGEARAGPATLPQHQTPPQVAPQASSRLGRLLRGSLCAATANARTPQHLLTSRTPPPAPPPSGAAGGVVGVARIRRVGARGAQPGVPRSAPLGGRRARKGAPLPLFAGAPVFKQAPVA